MVSNKIISFLYAFRTVENKTIKNKNQQQQQKKLKLSYLSELETLEKIQRGHNLRLERIGFVFFIW